MPGNAAAVKKQEELALEGCEPAFGQAADQTIERLLAHALLPPWARAPGNGTPVLQFRLR